MSYGIILAKLRKEKGYTQSDVAKHISLILDKPCSFKVVSHWENGVSSPSVEQFLLLCEYYGIADIQGTFRGAETEFPSLTKLNALGKSRIEEYISMISSNPLFSETESNNRKCERKTGSNSQANNSYERDNRNSDNYKSYNHAHDNQKIDRSGERNHGIIKLYDIPVAAGAGVFLDSEHFTELEIDETIPGDADFAVRVSGDSMEPRFVDCQVIFIKRQKTLEVGEIGIFALNGDSFVKKLGRGKLISLNPRYEPIAINEEDSLHVFGKVVG